MRYPVYAMRDVMNGFVQPLLDVNDYTAKRNFVFGINNNEQLAFNAKDYDFYKIGEFDQDTGEMISCLPELICHGVDVIGVKDA